MRVKAKSTIGLAMPSDIEVQPTDTVRQTIEKIAAIQACDPNGIALWFNGKPMAEDARLKDYGIKEGDGIEVGPRHRKGGIVLPTYFLQNRISLESQAIEREDLPLFPLTPYVWEGTIYGGRKWEGAYKVEMTIPETYPYSPPLVRWLTNLEPPHPNISNITNYVCLNILNPDIWRQDYTLITVYKSLEWLLEHPNYDNPLADFPRLNPSRRR